MAKLIKIDTLGECTFDSPFKAKCQKFFYDDNGIIRKVHAFDYPEGSSVDGIEYFERAGAREKIHFNPAEVIVGVVTCGGLCPGLNDVIRAVTFCAKEGYGVKKVLGFQYGFEGLVAKYFHPPIDLTPDNTDEIHEKGGTILKSSRGPQDTKEIVHTLRHYKVNILIAIGGDGTLRGARDIQDEIRVQGLDIAVIGVPKTIDNDIGVIERSFGFQTAVQVAWGIINCAHAEAKANRHGVGLVKLMGRESGWIATSAAAANSNVNFCLIPEVPFDLDGPNGFFEHLRRRLEKKDHAVVVVAEGAGQDLVPDHVAGVDKSGNKKLADIGVFLRDEMRRWFAKQKCEINVKYIDPSYTIRSTPANAADSEYCLFLGYNAMHAAMAGKIGMVVGLHNHRLVHLPIDMISARKLVDPHGWVWQGVLQTTRQPACMTNEE
ncbi:MAG: ATP-dependent 6-phosphofructokinase [Kiritimatiellales bacterium]